MTDRAASTTTDTANATTGTGTGTGAGTGTGTDLGTEAVSCRGLEYSFGDTKAVSHLDLSVRAGEVFGLLGPNGAGKTTAIRCITTLLPVPAGMVRVFGHDAATEKMAVRRLLGYVPQQLSADAQLTGRENVTLFARVFDVPRRERAERVAQALEAVDLTSAADRMAKTYSGGMIRRLELAQALVSAPRLLMLDEPTIGLDPIARTSVWEHINAVRHATGMTVLVTTHYMDEAEQYCDRVGLMNRGRIHALGTPDELRTELRERRRASAETAEAGTAKGEPVAKDDAMPTLEDVFREVAGRGLDEEGGDFRDVRNTRRTASRVG
ncbi:MULTISPECIES: ATP-binding cassette domain-containing protein [unclassified Streptomyces]|uniref:ABC transporter ATP-binding protein n=1 Tax=unclassified Streptomyces TaxID=2593676 RepID=UPI00081EB452|nr:MULTISPECIES: ATP-binding cassette domain-containing protein [unclassified Streptomyces]MYZ37703.1 ATP-binding cassette domain-containing protein [Streptomyces sp. SID4917]SCF93412.1 ABC-2 type transport system ATP-binding protein [Streptomyces sp. MnatMP-M17]